MTNSIRLNQHPLQTFLLSHKQNHSAQFVIVVHGARNVSEMRVSVMKYNIVRSNREECIE